MALTVLPKIMVAPNGARKTKEDHPNLPVTIAEVVTEAARCYTAGAGAVHAHVRDAEGAHVLDAGLYSELLQELATQVPEMVAQITTEAVGRYSPEEQRACVAAVKPRCVSIALREMTPGQDDAVLRRFYHDLCAEDVNVQHILYAPEEITQLAHFVQSGVIPAQNSEMLIVLGRYQKDQQSTADDLPPFISNFPSLPHQLPWAICAFGSRETECLKTAISLGGKTRIGFENNIFNADGSVAETNAMRVSELISAIGEE